MIYFILMSKKLASSLDQAFQQLFNYMPLKNRCFIFYAKYRKIRDNLNRLFLIKPLPPRY